MPEQTRQLAAIMFTDIVGYTTLMGEDEDRAIQELERNLQIQIPLIEENSGTFVKQMGDGILASFHSSLDAINCAVAIQEAIEEPSPQLRIGIHLGDILTKDGEVYGDGVNIASRIESIAPPGGILISGQMMDTIRNKIQYQTSFFGEKNLKNVSQPIRLYSVTSREESNTPSVPLDETSEKSIIVIPFENISSDPENEYFSDGLTDELIDTLAKLPELKVISRTSAFSLKKTDKDIRSLRNQFNVKYGLEGSVRKAGDRLRITAQLINLEDGYHLWSQRFDRHLDDIFEIQEEIAQRIVEELMIKLKGKLVEAPTENKKAYKAYLMGRYFWNKRTTAGLEKSLYYFKEGINLDPGFALAYVGLADSYRMQGHQNIYPPTSIFPKAKAAAQKALEINPNLAEALASLGAIVGGHDWNWSQSLNYVRQSIKINPNFAVARQWLSEVYAILGDFESALKSIGQAEELDPLSMVIKSTKGWLYFLDRKYDRAIEILEESKDLDDQFYLTYFYLGQIFIQKGDHQQALENLNRSLTLSGKEPGVISYLGYCYGVMGDKPKATAVLDQLDQLANQKYCSKFHHAVVHLGLNQEEEVKLFLLQAFEERSDLIIFINVDPIFDAVRERKWFQKLVDDLGLIRNSIT